MPVTVLNSITGKPLGGVDVDVKNTSAKTNSKGVATIALPTTATTYSAKLSSSGYNPATVTVQVTDQTVKANSFNLTPSGQIYFLSNASGTIDVVKSNLDGTGRKTILAGTGHEDPNSTSLLASRDWQFLVLDSKRDGTHETLTLIDTSDDKTVSFDNTTSDFQLIGWSNHYFMYDLVKSNQQIWQPGNEVIKSYDAEHQQLNQLDQSQAQGDPSTSYYFQRFSNFYIVDGSLVYLTQWDTGNSISPDYTGKLNTIRAVQPNGQNKKDYLSLSPSASTFGEVALYSPQAVYFSAFDTSSNPTYYDFEDLAAKPVKLDNSIFSQTYPTWLQSPSGNQTFWTELRDGKNTLFTGNSSAGNKKQIATNSDFTPYGWFSDNYLLVSKNSSELYVIPAGGLSSGQQPLKISNYYKPARTFNGYGGGYGGQ